MSDLTPSEIEGINQQICRRLVGREVIYCVSQAISVLASLDNSIDALDYEQDLLPLLEIRQYTLEFKYECGCGCEWSVGDDDPQDMIDECDYDEHCANCPECGEAVEPSDIEYEESDSCEIYEHWIVTDWLARKLSEHGHVTGDVLGMTIWGRPTTGQSISMDGVIRDIASDMGILYDQEHYWSETE